MPGKSASPDQMAQTMLANIPAKTGKTLAQWHALVKKNKLEKHGQIVKFLKADHGVTHGFANMIAHEYLNAGNDSNDDDLVAAQYAGAKAGLLPIYDAVIAAVEKFGADVEVSAKKSYVSLRRNKQFALVQASTKDRVDVGINLKGEAPTDRLEASGSFNSMVSHRVRLTKKSDVNAQLKKWLKQAFDAA